MDKQQAAELRKPFPPSAIGKIPKGGVQLDYVGHAAATDRLLTVDPEWTWEPLGLDEHGLPAIDAAGNLWIRLTICGVTRIGVGDGKNMKERIGDAIRNAAMRFGVALDLWAKEDLHEISAAALQPTPTVVAGEPDPDPGPVGESPLLDTSSALARRMFALFGEAGIKDKDKRLEFVTEVVARLVTSSTEMTTADAKAVIQALEYEASKKVPA